jgi:hypothetical protein
MISIMKESTGKIVGIRVTRMLTATDCRHLGL